MDSDLNRLGVYLHGKKAGTITRDPERFRFSYDQGYLANKGAMALSQMLPLEEGDPGYGVALKWFEGLLPEGERREQIARVVGAASMSTYSMLKAIGSECAGAVEVVVEGKGLEGTTEPTSKEEVEARIKRMRREPLTVERKYQTLSLAGAQAKFVLVREGGEWRWPIRGYPSTHIVKPEQDRFPGLVENEAVCMEIARRSGLRTATTWIEEFGGEKALVVERFDRDKSGGRIHQEDICQALGRDVKYEMQGGPTIVECARETAVDNKEVWDQAIFAWLVGDEDKHGKNYSIQYPAGEAARLAPIYDAVCTLAYPELDRGMAMRIGRAWEIREVNQGALENEAEKCGLDPEKALARTKQLAQAARVAVGNMRRDGWRTGRAGLVIEGNARKVAEMETKQRVITTGPAM